MATRNSDGSYDAKDSGGFGKDYHGQDAFGENIGGTGVGGNKFGGFESGHFGVGDGRDHYEREATSYGDVTATESPFEVEDANTVASAMRDSIRGMSSEMENSNTGASLDTSFQIGDMNEDLEKAKQEADAAQKAVDEFKETRKSLEKNLKDIKPSMASKALDALGMGSGYREDRLTPGLADLKDNLNKMADAYGIDHEDFNNVKSKDLNKVATELLDKIDKQFSDKARAAQSNYDNLKSSFTDKTSSIADEERRKGEEALPVKDYIEAKGGYKRGSKATTPSEVMEASKGPGANMKNAKPATSDYLTAANKDSSKEIAPSRDDFGNHAGDTLKGVADRVAKTTTDLGIKSPEEWAKENGYDPSKLSTMRAYNVYQTKEIIKAVPGVMKEVGSYIEERVKDAFDPSKLGTRVANTLARYNAATLIGAAILSIKAGAGLQASIDMALSSVDPADVPEVREALENALNDDGLVDDISILIDDAYSNMNSSKQRDIDSEIVNIGRKNTTDYSGFNAGLGTSSDKDVKVFITRNVKSDPVLRVLAKKLGK